jgi:hypothetical protein
LLNYSNYIINNNDWLVVQYDNREFFENNIENFNYTDYLKIVKINELYCKQNNLDYLFSSDQYNISPYWVKVKIIHDLMNNSDIKYKGFIWLDTDAVIINNNKLYNINTITNMDKSFFISHDNPKYGKGMLNCGIFIIKNNNIGKEIMNKWISGYDSSTWKLVNNRWSTTGPWVGITYEQGFFNQIIYPNYMNHIHELNWKLLQNNNPNDEEAIVSHFAFEDKKLINKYY